MKVVLATHGNGQKRFRLAAGPVGESWQTIHPVTNEQASKGRGCFFYGCLTAVVLFIVVAVGGYLAARATIRQISKFTQATPTALPKVDLPADELRTLRDRVGGFKQAVADQKPTDALVLTEREINALIGSDPDFAQLKDRVYVSLPGDEVKGQVSLPINRWPFKGRYLNGEATFKVALANGVLFVTVQSLRVGNDTVPDQFMQGFQQQNLAQDVNNDPQKAAALSKLESIEVKDGKLTLKAKAKQ